MSSFLEVIYTFAEMRNEATNAPRGSTCGAFHLVSPRHVTAVVVYRQNKRCVIGIGVQHKDSLNMIWSDCSCRTVTEAFPPPRGTVWNGTKGLKILSSAQSHCDGNKQGLF